MLFPPLLVFLGAANSIYAYLNLKLLRGLSNLARPRTAPPFPHPNLTQLNAAPNQQTPIRQFQDCLRLQDYPWDKLQIVVVNDRSTDATEDILRDYAIRWPGRFNAITLTETAPGYSPKKYALSRGLLQATGDIIVTTDADCIMAPAWIST